MLVFWIISVLAVIALAAYPLITGKELPVMDEPPSTQVVPLSGSAVYPRVGRYSPWVQAARRVQQGPEGAAGASAPHASAPVAE